MSTRKRRWGFIVGLVALTIGGIALGQSVGQNPPATAATVTRGARTVVVHHTRVIKRVVRGKVVRLKSGQRVIRVPLVVIHNLRCHPTRRHHCVRRVVVPAHSIPLRVATSGPVAVAAVTMPVTVYATVTSPPVTVTLPVQTVTLPQDTTTVFVPTTITVTAPPVS